MATPSKKWDFLAKGNPDIPSFPTIVSSYIPITPGNKGHNEKSIRTVVARSVVIDHGATVHYLKSWASLACVGPLSYGIQKTKGLSNGLLGLPTTLLQMAFGAMSTLPPLVTRKPRIGWTLFMAMALLTTGIAVRSLGPIFPLYFGTLLIGIAVAFGDVLLPGLTKHNFSSKSGLTTRIYSSVMTIGASLAARVSVPLVDHKSMGWEGFLAIWAICAGITGLFWIPQISRMKDHGISINTDGPD